MLLNLQQGAPLNREHNLNLYEDRTESLPCRKHDRKLEHVISWLPLSPISQCEILFAVFKIQNLIITQTVIDASIVIAAATAAIDGSSFESIIVNIILSIKVFS
jgi:hypothetical protein